MENYSGFEELLVTLNTTQGVLTGSFIGFDSESACHLMNINGEVTSVPHQSILSLISTSSFQIFDEFNNTKINVNIDPGGTGIIHYRSARAVSAAQPPPTYKSWEELNSALQASIRQPHI